MHWLHEPKSKQLLISSEKPMFAIESIKTLRYSKAACFKLFRLMWGFMSFMLGDWAPTSTSLPMPSTNTMSYANSISIKPGRKVKSKNLFKEEGKKQPF